MGPEILTYTGKAINIFDPKPEDICIEDIAHALALCNRFNGHTRFPYSVAQHSVLMSGADFPGDPLYRLLHDSAEAYMGDFASPHKERIFYEMDGADGFCGEASAIESLVLDTIYEGLKLPWGCQEDWECRMVKKADLRMLCAEVDQLMPPNAGPYFAQVLRGTRAAWVTINPWSWETAEEAFLLRFKELTK